jgi:adenylate kinase
MRLILLGPPGSGKGTQAKLLCEELRLAHIGTGDILRDAIRRLTPLGKKAKPYVDSGRLVPDELVNELMAERFRRDDRPQRFVMDGYPRTVAQAVAFDAVLRQQHLNLTAVLRLLVDDEEIVARLSGRWSCPYPGCQRTYHTTHNPPKRAGYCDADNTLLVQREDDKEETIRRRLQVYHANTEQLVSHYRAQGLLREVNGQGPIEEIHQHITQVLRLQAGPSC